MLTKTDLKEIRKIVREEVETEIQNVRGDLQAEMKMNLLRTLSEIREVKDRLKNIEIQVNIIRKDLKYSVDFLDKMGLKTQKRIRRVEKHLRLPPVS